MKLLQHCPDDAITRPEWITDMGDYNSLPEPNRECNIHRLIHLLATHTPTAMDHRQVVIHSMGGMLRDTKILFFPHCAIALVMPQSWITVRDNKLCGEGKNATGIEYTLSECRFFEIGCEHEYTERGSNCYRVNECDICGHIKSVDSSG